MRIVSPKPTLAVLAALVVLAPSPVAAKERCEVRYAVRVAQDEQGVDTGSAIRSFSTCVSSLTYCHTHAKELAKAHADETLASEGQSADVASVTIVKITTHGDCD